MQEYRCKKCGKLLFLGYFVGQIEAKCPRCNVLSKWDEHVQAEEESFQNNRFVRFNAFEQN
jgi:phage FluMu protein Com